MAERFKASVIVHERKETREALGAVGTFLSLVGMVQDSEPAILTGIAMIAVGGVIDNVKDTKEFLRTRDRKHRLRNVASFVSYGLIH
ncbi:MAG TPA: hypothetical protein VLE91_00070 [Candidatus Saccharimonadales bacterium]|nr:hypothetical protein [Candidatus Saccharimonadales bacterium]